MLEGTMQVVLYSLTRMPSYGPWWLVFVGLVFLAARFMHWPFVYLAFVIVVCLVHYLETTTAKFNASAEPDFFSFYGIVIRIAIVCIILTPVALLGNRLKKRSSK